MGTDHGFGFQNRGLSPFFFPIFFPFFHPPIYDISTFGRATVFSLRISE